jgi:pyruvate dehydrogenase E2 component (dihydrolipoamide acetyltransferase)
MTQVKKFVMPDVGEGLTEADIVAWQVAPGDRVTDGQVIVEVETAKAVVELPCPFDGVVAELLAGDGETVAVGTPIIAVAVEDEGAGGDEGGPGLRPVADEAPAEEDAGPEPRDPHATGQAVLVGYGPRTAGTRRRPRTPAAPAPKAPAAPEVPTAPEVPAAGPARTPVLAKPPVRKLARDLGVDLATVTPTGPGGTVTRGDVEALVATPAGAAALGVAGAGDHRIPVKGVRRATARAMVTSAFTAPHVTEWVQVDVTRTVKLVKRLRELPELAEARVTPLLLVARAFLAAARRYPQINASWDEAAQEIVVHGRVNLGIAAATPRGLLVPNIKDAGGLTLAELAAALTGLTETARAGRSTPEDLARGTLTITNVGVFGVDGGTPILNPGEAAILAVGAFRELPWVHKGKVRPRRVTTLSLSFDHRMVDGELGSKVLADVAAMLERPELLLARS